MHFKNNWQYSKFIFKLVGLVFLTQIYSRTWVVAVQSFKCSIWGCRWGVGASMWCVGTKARGVGSQVPSHPTEFNSWLWELLSLVCPALHLFIWNAVDLSWPHCICFYKYQEIFYLFIYLLFNITVAPHSNTAAIYRRSDRNAKCSGWCLVSAGERVELMSSVLQLTQPTSSSEVIVFTNYRVICHCFIDVCSCDTDLTRCWATWAI